MDIIKTGTFNECGEISAINNYDYSNKIKQLTTKEKKYYLDKAKSLDVNNIATITDYDGIKYYLNKEDCKKYHIKYYNNLQLFSMKENFKNYE